MREFRTQDGNIIHLPDTIQRTIRSLAAAQYQCACHVRLGNDFYFLPRNIYLRKEKVCDNPEQSK